MRNWKKHFNYVDQPEGYKGKAIVGERLSRWSEGQGDVNTKPISEVSRLAFEIDRKLKNLCPELTPDVQLVFGETYG